VKIYQVGGSIRDELLGLPVSDRDWVVVGSTPQAMLDAGYKQVGADFPVFLHPETHEEYALARTERKSAPGYRGFVVHAAPDVTLEDDLRRRDFTINAMARAEDGQLIDLFKGEDDLRRRVFRHVSDAFTEDPVRILRGARFLARFEFQFAPETLALMRAMVDAGEVDALVPERVWQEVARGLNEARPLAMLRALNECGALARLAPEWLCVLSDPFSEAAIESAISEKLGTKERFAVLNAGLSDAAVRSLIARLRIPNDCRDLALLLVRELPVLMRPMDAAALAQLLQRADAFRQPERFAALAQTAQCVLLARGVTPEEALPSMLSKALMAARGVDAEAIAGKAASQKDIPQLLIAARTEAIKYVGL
jgi:tRNA nucleotidyltransferase (CCA-adding enzyme)